MIATTLGLVVVTIFTRLQLMLLRKRQAELTQRVDALQVQAEHIASCARAGMRP